ncbi:MAG: carbohydrate-binding domain-containing protein [Clostridia bacterium]|nr:carbohydrate-binding domain-containing protein [Clostridia bacterium]
MRTIKILFLSVMLSAAALLLPSCVSLTLPYGETEQSTAKTEQPVSEPIYSIKFEGNRFIFTGEASALSADGTTLTITEGGTYELSGYLSEGNIVIDVGEDEDIRIILDSGFSLSSSDTPPIYVKSAASASIEIKKDETGISFEGLSENS